MNGSQVSALRGKTFRVFYMVLLLGFGFVVSPLTVRGQKMIYPISERDKWGFIDESGKIVVPAKYDDAGELHEGLAKVLEGNLWGYINAKGEKVIKPQYTTAQDFSSSGLASVAIGKVSFYIDKEGTFRGKKLSTTAPEGFSEGLVRDRRINKWGFKNIKNEQVIPYKYDWAGKFNEGFAPVKLNGMYGFVNKRGKEISLEFEAAKEFREGLAAVIKNNKLGFINKSGKFVINPQFDGVEEQGFVNGYAVVRVNDKYGFISKTGKLIVPPRYTRAKPFSRNGLAAVFIGSQIMGKWGFINRKGELVLDAQFDEADMFRGKLSFVKKGRQAAYINEKGEYVWKEEL